MNSPVLEGAFPRRESRLRRVFLLLWRDKFAFASAVFLLLVILSALFGPLFLEQPATSVNLGARNAPPFTLDRGWLFILGADALGRSILARLIVASQNTMLIAAVSVLCAMALGGVLGLLAGYRGGWVATLVLRGADIIMSFPSLLLAMIVLYMLEPQVSNVIIVLVITRLPIYIRTIRAEVLEIRERVFVTAAFLMGASPRRLIWKHIAPFAAPTLMTIATIEFAYVMLTESSLSFLGLGIQPPEITWGLMVAEGRRYISSAWWLAFWPGLAIMLTALASTLLASWLRVVTDPTQAWRLEANDA